ncbi:MAG: sensor domain-containing diguanylate cyclase [Kofleriaceae bacterium]|nr:sensor domain-containing diguanylate cyclase [Kofleriaceae bacterium]
MNQAQLQKLPAVLFEIGKLVGSDVDPGLLLTRIAELVCQVIDAQACSVMLLDESRERLMTKAAYGLRADRLLSLSFAVGEGVAGWVAQHGDAVLLPDAVADSRFLQLPGNRTMIASLICVPLIARGERVGVVTATSNHKNAFQQSDLELVSFIATTIALDIENVRLHRVAVTDPLTGVYNREFLGTKLPAEIEMAIARGRSLSVAMVDVDHFKRINDAHGHGVGDVVLAAIAGRLRNAIRAGDILVRYGGEEFLVLLPKAGIERASEVGERIRERACDGPIDAGNDILVEITVSVGVAELRTEPLETMQEFIARADTALYAAKAAGRNCVHIAE